MGAGPVRALPLALLGFPWLVLLVVTVLLVVAGGLAGRWCWLPVGTPLHTSGQDSQGTAA